MGIRPIVSSCESPTENISQFIDYWLQPLMKAIPSYLKDTTKLTNQLKELTVEPDIRFLMLNHYTPVSLIKKVSKPVLKLLKT